MQVCKPCSNYAEGFYYLQSWKEARRKSKNIEMKSTQEKETRKTVIMCSYADHKL